MGTRTMQEGRSNLMSSVGKYKPLGWTVLVGRSFGRLAVFFSRPGGRVGGNLCARFERDCGNGGGSERDRKDPSRPP